jgi:restriction endonuclease S subunit
MEQVSIQNTLDPLLDKLTRDYVDDEDLSERLQRLFKVGFTLQVQPHHNSASTFSSSQAQISGC